VTVTNPQTLADRLVVDLGAEAGISYFEQSLFPKLGRRRAEGVRLPGIDDISRDLYQTHGPIPARVSLGKQGRDDYLHLYINGRYALLLNVSKYGHGYIIGDVRRLSLRDQDEIVRGGFALAARQWQLYDHPRDLPQQLDARWPEVKTAWRSRPKPDGTAASQQTLPGRHQRYLDDLKQIIDKALEVELSGTSSERMCRYQRITPAATRRRTAQSVYKFQLMGDFRLVAGSKVHIDEHPGLRGTITEIRESLITVRFEQPLDFDHIPPLGAFVASPNTIGLDKQAEAIHTLREQRAQNPRLLDVLVDHAFQPFRSATATPRETLDASQEAAFRKALTVPDLALIQGPPGTGKTRTIKQVVSEAATGPTRANAILVSAYTNQAVDNVLKGLPKNLTVIRVGTGVTPTCEHLTLEAQATNLQQRILDRTERVLARYAKADPEGGAAVQRLTELASERTELIEAVACERRTEIELSRHDAAITAPFRSRLDKLATELASQESVAAERAQQAKEAAVRQDAAAKTAALPLIGVLFRHRAERHAAAATEAASAAAQAGSEAATTRNLQERTQAELTSLRATDPGLTELRARVREARHSVQSHSERTVASAHRLADSLGDVSALPPISPDPAVLSRFHDAATEAVALAQRRLLLLRKWRATLERRTEQLYPELIRYADVVGATCIGAATSKNLNDVTFDLAIIDEAGQISSANLLVPLVRARRAVLVGDHVQLPPFAERQLEQWAREQSPALADLVAKSAFELLFRYVPDGSRQMLTIQRRMPRAVGDFISGQFYSGRLRTETERPDRDELFASTMAFVDTAELPTGQRRERYPRQGEPWPDKSYVNDAEARLIADLVAYYDTRKSDWVVIVPFTAQEGRVSALIADRLGDEERAASRVASVDSFQGGEHDTVIFGFTRSNSGGAVGFFSDVRRSNVAFSRAKRRFIMVGDMSTLLNASDAGFRSMMTALHDHLRQRGDLRGYREIFALLARESGQ
jgi:AAA domain-containing protein